MEVFSTPLFPPLSAQKTTKILENLLFWKYFFYALISTPFGTKKYQNTGKAAVGPAGPAEELAKGILK